MTRFLGYVAKRIIRTGLWNLGYRMKTTNQILEFRLPDKNYELDFGIMLPDETTNRTLEFRLLDENYKPDFRIICQTNYTTWK
uniref:Uncharacterized protein n=1 Tax=Rhizophagus irregularis (strain DAOM 181602 / DAOM 197198 / MUCL 43194) TaxID=747089 RepID=U9U8E7_RHIID